MTATIPRRARAAIPAALACILALPAVALTLSLPEGAQQTAAELADPDSYPLPTGPWTFDTGVPAVRLVGAISRAAWRIPGDGRTTEQILAPLRDQVIAAGYEIVFECRTRACGGFDFRFGTYVMPAPAMYVDLTDFRFLAARSRDGADHLSLLVSGNDAAGFVQIVQQAPTGTTPDATLPDAPALSNLPPARAPDDLVGLLETRGHVVLSDLRFETGSAELGGGPFASLDALATYLRATPEARVALVGHTDAVGGLDGNIALSRRRAQSVLSFLRDRLDVPGRQLQADGVGYLSPVTSNLSAEGRVRNRRVEAVLLTTE